MLAEAVAHSDDQQVHDGVLDALRQLTDWRQIGAVCGIWVNTRHPDLIAFLTMPETTRMLVEIVMQSDDERVRDAAWQALGQLTNQDSIDAVCQVWAETRHAALAALLAERGWVASMPPKPRLLTALRIERLDVLRDGEAGFVELLMEACVDADSIIAERAQHALRNLKNKGAQDAVCQLVIERDDPVAREAALAAGYVPQDEQQRALFFFLTEQWERYDLLDFDRQFLRAAYEEADNHLRQWVREKLRASGRADFLTVITGQDYRASVLEMSPGELNLFLQTLIANREWPTLWDLVFEVRFAWSARIVEALAGSEWRPQNGEDVPIFEELVSYAGQGLAAREDQMEQLFSSVFQQVQADQPQLFPPAVLRAKARVPGRINSVAFSPTRPVIAVGTGRRKVVLWNYQRAEREYVLGGFKRSIGPVTFTSDGALLAAERTNRRDNVCTIYAWDNPWQDEVPFPLGEHTGSVTALEPVGTSLVISTGRDGEVVLWDVSSRREVARQRYARYDGWAKTACVSPDERRVAVVGTWGVKIISLPQLKDLRPWLGQSKARYAAFPPQEETMILGQSDGDVVTCGPQKKMMRYWNGANWYEEERTWLTREGQPLTHHEGWMKGVEMLCNSSIVVSAAFDGSIHFTDLENRTSVGNVHVPDGPLTSLHISPDESFMAVGSSEAVLSLWDLRGLVIPGVLLQPFAQSAVLVVPILGNLIDNESLPPQARLALKFAACVLRHRFRYDIEIGELPMIMMGEFDIEIE